MDDDWRRTWHAVRDLLGAKWSLHAIRTLADRQRGFNDLKSELDGATAKTLSARLDELRCVGVVEREVHPTAPPTTTYRLTDHGESLAAVLDDLAVLVEVGDCAEAASDGCPLDGDCPVPAARSACGTDGAASAATCACAREC